MTAKRIIALKTITEFHRSRGLPPPQHPLVSIVNYADVHLPAEAVGASWVYDFYSIAIKRNLNAKMHYGQKEYDFDEGVMFFIAPGQVFSVSFDGTESWDRSGWILLLHPDFLWKSMLAESINRYEYFGYAVNEALHLSEKEETIMKGIIENIQLEYHANIDRFSQGIIITQIETMLAYAERFYQRQFITRQVSNYEILTRFEKILQQYFETDLQFSIGLPTVKHLATELNLSANYLSSVLKTLTGNSPQQHIHHFLIEKAKIKLSSTAQSVSEIAYELGFEHPQSFNKLFKSKTNLSPLAFRAKFY